MQNCNTTIKALEQKLSYEFNDKNILCIAITHSSYAKENNTNNYNERMEFLGDSVLQLVITKYLFENYKTKLEGELTRIRSLIVCEHSLHQISQKWDLGKYIFMSKGEEQTGGRSRVSILADAVEAIIAAIYLDKGLLIAEQFILDNFIDIMDKAVHNKLILDYKTKLQEKLQKNGDINIEYNLTSFEGPPHRREFFMEVLINGKVMGNGKGFSKKEAEQSAAKATLVMLGDLDG